MKLINKLNREDRGKVLRSYKHKLKNEVEYKNTVGWLDDFLADLGFKLLYPYSPEYHYDYDNGDWIDVRTNYGEPTWCVLFYDETNDKIVKFKFRFVNELIDFLSEV